jgi:hypothetical protein
MTLLQKQSYIAWFQFLGNKAIEWRDKSSNNDIKNVVKAVNEIGVYVVGLENENYILQKRIEIEREKRLAAEAELYHFK